MKIYPFIAAISVSILVSCSSQPVTLTNAMGLSKSEMAIIKMDRTERPGRWTTFISTVRDLDLESWTRMDGTTVHVAPGQYELHLSAHNGSYSSYPKVVINARAGKTYLVHCISVGDNKVGAFFKETVTAADNPAATSTDKSSDQLR